ncbi:MAG: sulfatase, partial [Pseudomonadota bacterium]
SIYDEGPPLLFDLDADPDELVNLAADPTYAAVREALHAELTAGWDPQTICQQMARARLDKDILAAWASQVRPAEQYIWHFDAEINRLDV